MEKTPSIKIVVSCHKEVCVPKSDLYYPVHLGAIAAKAPLPGMQPDSEGDNISSRNFTFCELTAQYWAWKHLDADYIGQCHYRRYFCFDGVKRKANDHRQVEVPILSPYTIDEFRLADDELIRSQVANHDVVTGHTWNVSVADTLDGVKRTVREHMIGYGLLTSDDFDRLIEITDRVAPEYAETLRAYLDGSSYLGYNCFIMKRDIFNRLCSFEFPILLEFDRTFDYSDMRTTRKRICGYLAEVLYSVFINQLKKEKACRILERPLLFFHETPKPYRFETNESGGTVHIFWRFLGDKAVSLVPALDSLVGNLSEDKSYRLTVIHNERFDFAELKRFVRAVPSNLCVEDVVFPALDCAPVRNGVSPEEFSVLLPVLLAEKRDDAFLWVDGIAVFECDPAELLQAAQADPEAPIVAMQGLWLQKELNKPCNAGVLAPYRSFCGKGTMLDTSVLAVNCRELRMRSQEELIALFRDCTGVCGIDDIAVEMSRAARHFADCVESFGFERDLFTPPVSICAALSAMLCRIGAVSFSLETVYPVLSEDEVKIWANEKDAIAWSACGEAGMYCYHPEANPLNDMRNARSSAYWRRARVSDAYESLLLLVTDRLSRRVSLKNRLLPPFSFRRRALGKLRRILKSWRP